MASNPPLQNLLSHQKLKSLQETQDSRRRRRNKRFIIQLERSRVICVV
uniref:Uncharacterized protein n=1 Tax=Lepeophtheirus salmonis TaxID=72036 RepID=A0A0K2TC73_LEPSM